MGLCLQYLRLAVDEELMIAVASAQAPYVKGSVAPTNLSLNPDASSAVLTPALLGTG